jgi:hypothetical protein
LAKSRSSWLLTERVTTSLAAGESTLTIWGTFLVTDVAINRAEIKNYGQSFRASQIKPLGGPKSGAYI